MTTDEVGRGEKKTGGRLDGGREEWEGGGVEGGRGGRGDSVGLGPGRGLESCPGVVVVVVVLLLCLGK